MSLISAFEQHLSEVNRQIFRSFQHPNDIQNYLDSLPYIAEERDRSPVAVMQDQQCHCLDGALFGALALKRLGYPPRILDLVPEMGADDDHVLALYQIDGYWGAIAKSNYVGLRYREPVHRTLRELTLSYFEPFFNTERRKTLRAYTRPLTLDRFADTCWPWQEAGVTQITRVLYQRKPIPLITRAQIDQLSLVDQRSYQALTQGTNFDWVYGGENR